MGQFIKENLPDPASFFEAQGLKLTGKGKWRTTSCRFHGGSDSLRVNVTTGGWVCMSCGAKGGDVLAYQMQSHEQSFMQAAQVLGAWLDDGKQSTAQRPTPLTARQALQVLMVESNLAAVAASNLAHGKVLTAQDRARLLLAAMRINRLSEAFQ